MSVLFDALFFTLFEMIIVKKEQATIDGKSNKKNINQNHGHNVKKEALRPNTKRN